MCNVCVCVELTELPTVRAPEEMTYDVLVTHHYVHHAVHRGQHQHVRSLAVCRGNGRKESGCYKSTVGTFMATS